VKDLLEHLKNYWKVYLLFVALTALCFLIGSLIGGRSTGLAWAMVVDGSLMIMIILLQVGRGGGLVGALGGMGGQSAFGTRAGDAFTGITIVLTVMWVLLAGFGGITLRADRGNQTFDQPVVRLLESIERWEGNGQRTILVPLYLNGTPAEDVEVSLTIRDDDNGGTLAAHHVDTKKKLVTFEANTPELRQTVEVKYDGDSEPSADWSFMIRISNIENAIPKVGEEITRVTIKDDDGGLGELELKSAKDLIPGSSEAAPTEKTPAAEKPAEKKPAAKKPAVKKPAEKKPAVKKPAVKKPAEKKPAEKKPAAKKPAVKKPAEQPGN